MIGLLLILPNVWLQYSHNWSLFHHIEELQETQLKFVSPFDFIKDQILMLFPVVFVWIGTLPDSTKANMVIYCRNYGQAGSLKFYGKDAYFKNIVISDNGSFLFWIPERLWFKHLIFIGRRMSEKDDEVFQHFEKASIIDSVTNQYSRQLGDKIIFFENTDDKVAELARQGLNEMKKKFHR